MNRPIRLVTSTISPGGGGGIARMDTFYHRFLNRDRFDPLFVIARAKNEAEIPYDPTLDYHYTGDFDRFAKLVALFSDADIVQFMGGFDPVSAEAARVANVPVIVELMHMVEPGQLYPYIDTTLCVSRTAQRAQPDPARTVVVHNGIDVEQFGYREERDRSRIVILEASRREKPKHFHLDQLAADLLALDPRVELWLAGNGQTGESTDRVKFLGPRADIADLYRQADLLFLMSVVEPFGLVALEGMAGGALPVVADDG
ncbi:MAG: glycosyltransferase, partial [Nitrospinae bacterium]|nr:glycosyltransferase [Nitrospinota bacterium]